MRGEGVLMHQVESWADEGEPSESKLRENAILDASVFDVQPRRGTLR